MANYTGSIETSSVEVLLYQFRKLIPNMRTSAPHESRRMKEYKDTVRKVIVKRLKRP